MRSVVDVLFTLVRAMVIVLLECTSFVVVCGMREKWLLLAFLGCDNGRLGCSARFVATWYKKPVEFVVERAVAVRSLKIKFCISSGICTVKVVEWLFEFF